MSVARFRGPATGNLGDLIRPDVAPGRVGLIDLSESGREWTYGALDAAAEAFAAALVHQDLQSGDRVAILADNCAEHVIAYLGTMRAGGVAVPVNHRLPLETVHYILRDSEARLCVADSARVQQVPDGLPRILIRDNGTSGFGAFIDPFRGRAAERRSSRETAEILYTSGSTGRPKGVVLSHAGQLWALGVHVTALPGVGESTVIVAPLYHMNALFALSVSLLNGVTVVLLPRFEVSSYLRAVAQYRCTTLSGIPTMFALMVRQTELTDTLDLTSVEHISIGSAPLTESLIERVRNLFPRAQVSNGYGTTEAGPSIFGEHPRGLPRPALSLGYPIPEVNVRLAGGSGDEGTLQVQSPAMFSEYLHLPEITAQKLRDAWYDTGDVMRRDEQGFYFFTGRADDMFVCGGENVFPGEIEKMLEQHPGVLQAAVVPVPDEIKGEIPIAFVVLKDPDLSAQDLKRFSLANGPAFSHPRAFVVVSELPVATTHKLDKRPLRPKALEVAAALRR
jgi:acyl-CoA synthetase (AMP-forming)/AMP-acid ligase II